MKCALEMNVVVVDAQMAEALREEARQAEIRRNKACAEEAAIKFCETEIAKLIEQTAKQGKRWCNVVLGLHYWFTDPYANQGLCSRLKCDGTYYANGDESEVMYGAPMSVDAIVKHLESFCYKVVVQEGWEYKTYMCGAQKSVRFEIHIPESVPCL